MAGIQDAQIKRLLQTPLLLVQLDARMALAAGALCLATSLLIGALAAWEASRPQVAAVLRNAGPTATAELTGTRWRWTLVAVQVGLSVVLLAGMGLLARSLEALLALPTGLPLDRVDRKSTRLNSSHRSLSRMPSSA